MPAELRPAAVRGLVEGLASRMRWPRPSPATIRFEVPGPVLAQAWRLREVIDPAREYCFQSSDGHVAVTVRGSELVELLDRIIGSEAGRQGP